MTTRGHVMTRIVGLQQQCDDKSQEIAIKKLKEQTGKHKRHKNTVICLWNNAGGIKTAEWQVGRCLDICL